MRRSNDKNRGNYSGKSITSQTLLYQHMSNHYRRILNAKKAVDTTPPVSLKISRKIRCSSSSPVRICTKNEKIISRNISPAPTQRSVSTYSNLDSLWAAESCVTRKLQSNQMRHRECLVSNSVWKDTKCINGIHGYRSIYEPKKVVDNINFDRNCKKPSLNKINVPVHKRKYKDKLPMDIMDKYSKFFISYNNSFHPRILKTDAISKIKGLRVYHPPRKKCVKERSSPWVQNAERKNVEVRIMTSNCKENQICRKAKDSNRGSQQTKSTTEICQTSSRDSAYNGGVSSLPESRSPTPDQRKQSCLCHTNDNDIYYQNVKINENVIVPSLKLVENQDSQTEITHVSAHKVNKIPKSSDCLKMSQSDDEINKRNQLPKKTTSNDKESNKREIKEEALYTNFIKDITTEILEKGLYTNKALKKVMKKHMLSNLHLLDKNRMLKEVDKLRLQLGIPEDEDLFDFKLGSTESTADLDDCPSVISDSELIDPGFLYKNSIKPKDKRNSFTDSHFSRGKEDLHYLSDTDKSFPKSISEVLHRAEENNEIVLDSDSDDEEDELISVIHVTKLIKDGRKSDVCDIAMPAEQHRSLTQSNSADESEQSSDHVTRKKKAHTKLRKPEKSSSSSDEQGFPSCGNKWHFGGKMEDVGSSKLISSPSKGLTPNTHENECKDTDEEEDDSK